MLFRAAIFWDVRHLEDFCNNALTRDTSFHRLTVRYALFGGELLTPRSLNQRWSREQNLPSAPCLLRNPDNSRDKTIWCQISVVFYILVCPSF
jgi:hypothetical protein